MLSSIKKFFEDHLQPEISDGITNAKGIEYATAALLIELAKSDFAEHPTERQLIIAMLQDTFALADADLQELLALAESGTSDANDIFQFTSLVNDHYTNDQKIMLLENFWKVAYADGRLDKYEEQFIRKVAGLINLPPSEFTKTKHRVKQSVEA